MLLFITLSCVAIAFAFPTTLHEARQTKPYQSKAVKQAQIHSSNKVISLTSKPRFRYSGYPEHATLCYVVDIAVFVSSLNLYRSY